MQVYASTTWMTTMTWIRKIVISTTSTPDLLPRLGWPRRHVWADNSRNLITSSTQRRKRSALPLENPLLTPSNLAGFVNFSDVAKVKSNIWCFRSSEFGLRCQHQYRSPSAITLIIRFRRVRCEKANELIAHVYTFICNELPTTDCASSRFTVLGATGYGVL